MYKAFITGGALLLSSRLFSLSCSDPITISASLFQAGENAGASLFINDRGDAAVMWVSEDLRKEAVNIAYKIQNTQWSAAETIFKGDTISHWNDGICGIECFIRSDGELRAIWGGSDQEVFGAKKGLDEPWSMSTILSTLPMNHSLSNCIFDSQGQLVSIIASERKQIMHFNYLWGSWYETTDPKISIITQSSEGEQIQDEFRIKDNSLNPIPLFLIMNKNRVGYAFWYTPNKDWRSIPICRKIENNRFVLEPAVICQDSYVYTIEASLNEQGDLAIVYTESSDNVKIQTIFQDAWSEPFTFATKDECPNLPDISIDNAGNIMGVCGVDIGKVYHLKMVYKPFGQSWATPILFPVPNLIPWSVGVSSDGAGNFVMTWEEAARNRYTIHGASFSTALQSWSDPQRLSPEGESCSNYSAKFWAPGRGYICWLRTANGFDHTVQVAELNN